MSDGNPMKAHFIKLNYEEIKENYGIHRKNVGHRRICLK